MPGIPLLNLGYGLGGLVQGYQNQQSQGLQQALQRLALQQAQSQSNAQTLAGLALQAGLLNPTSGGGPLSQISNPLPQTGGAPAAAQPPAAGGLITTGTVPGVAQGTPTQNAFNTVAGGQPPPPGGPPGTTYPPPPATPVAPQQTFTPPSPFSLGEAQSAEDYPPIYGPGPGQPNISQAPNQQQSPPPPPAPAPQQTDQNGDTSSAPARSDSSSAPSPSGGGGVGIQLPSGQVIDMSTMFRQIDYQKLAQGIAQLAPRGTSQADIYAAVVDLGKLADGDKVQQQQAGALLRALVGGDFKLAATGMTTASAERRTAATQAGAGERQAAGAASRERIAQANRESREKIAADAQQLRRDSMNIRNANDQARIQQSAQRIAISAQNAGRAEIALQIQSLSRQIATIRAQPDGSFTDQQQQQLKALSDRIAGWAAQAAQGISEQAP